MKAYKQVAEDAEYRELYDSYRRTVENLNSTDYLYKSNLSNGQLFFIEDEMYGFVNNQPAMRGRNITISSDFIDNFVIRDFQVYSRFTNEIITLNVNVNLADFRDGKMHYLYVVLSHRGKYEVHDDMFQSDETKILFARFLIDTMGNCVQFYVMLPFAGSADYLKGNQFFQVTDGLRVKLLNSNTKQLKLTKAKIRFSGINFEDLSSPDCITIDHGNNPVPIRYTYFDYNDSVPRVDWTGNTYESLQVDKVINYNTGNITTVTDGKFSIQKLYYDVYERCLVALYGNRAYDTREEAILNIDSVMSYTLPDGIEYLIPVAAVVIQRTSSALNDNNFKVVNLDYNEQEVLDSDTFTRQQAAEAMNKANQALELAGGVDTTLSSHTNLRNNPHQVTAAQLGIDSSYLNTTVSAILQSAANSAADLYYKKSGGTISGDVTISNSKKLTVTGQTDLNSTVNVGGILNVNGSIIPYNDTGISIGSASKRIYEVNTYQLNVDYITYLRGNTYVRTVLPESTLSYTLGSSNARFFDVYTQYVDASNQITCGSLYTSGAITGDSASVSDLVANRIDVTNGYLVLGSYSLKLGGAGDIPTQDGYGIW